MKTKTEIGIRLTVEGLHYYPDASENHGEQVKFLEFPHRHNFHIICKMKVDHDNRQEEFIILKHKVEEFLFTEYIISDRHFETFSILDFGSMSCEMIAKVIREKFDFDYVYVDEDGENFAEVTALREEKEEEPKEIDEPKGEPKAISTPTIHFVFGQMCAGKSTWTQNRVQEDIKDSVKVEVIEIGQIVHKIKKEKSEGRIFDKKLDLIIFEIIQDAILRSLADKIYIVGVRQYSLLTWLIQFITMNKFQYVLHVVSAPRGERKKRFNDLKSLGSKKYREDFEEVEQAEKELGIDRLLFYVMDKKKFGEYIVHFTSKIN